MKRIEKLRQSIQFAGAEVGQARARNVTWVAAMLLISGLITLVFYGFVLTRLAVWQIYVVLATIGVLLASSAAGLLLARRGKAVQGAWMLLGGLWLVLLPNAMFISGMGILLGLAGLVVTLAIATQTLPERQVNLAVVLTIVAAEAAGILGIYLVDFQVAVPNLERFLPVMIVAVMAILLIFIAWQFRSLSLSNKFVVTFLAIALVMALALTTFAQNRTRQALTSSTGQGLSSLARSQAQAVGDLLERQIGGLQALALNQEMQIYIRAQAFSYLYDEAAIRAAIEEINRQWQRAYLLQDSTSALVSARINSRGAAALKDYARTFPENIEMMLSDRHGALVAANRLVAKYDLSREPWWQAAYNGGSGAIYIGSVALDERLGEYTLLFAVPVKDIETGQVIGVLQSTYLLSPLSELLADVALGESGDSDLLFLGEQPLRLHQFYMAPIGDELNAMIPALMQQNYLEISYEETPALASVAPVASTRRNPTISALGWAVFIHQSSQEALAPVEQQTQAILLLAMIIVGVVSGAAILLAQLLAGPINRLTRVAAQVSGGDLAARARVESRDEIGRLAQAFNHMTDQLRQALAGMEQRVAERTRELSLAGETGRALAQIRDLDILVRNAVELIQFSFDLYYVQVYLVDRAARSLVLQAGSGSVGEELLRRRHRLPIGVGSINGSVAAERRPRIVSDTASSLIFRPNPLLPNTRSEMSVPLLSGERVLGVLDMQSEKAGAFTEENLPAFQALAAQLAIAVENAELFLQAQQARTELQEQSRRLTRAGWSEFLDAIERSERLGYVVGEDRELRLEFGALAAPANSVSLSVPIEVGGETVGEIHLARPPERGWSQGEQELVGSVAGQVARQVESLRLLAQAERYRLEAEEAARRLTREGWREYLDTLSKREIGFVYDQRMAGQVQVSAVEPSQPTADVFIQPLNVSDEQIGELVIENEQALDEGELELVNTIAERLSAHLENLRLAAQTQAALATSDALYAGSEAVVRATSNETVLRALIEKTELSRFDHASIVTYDAISGEALPAATVLATWERSGAPSSLKVGSSMPMNTSPFFRLLKRDEPIFIGDVLTYEQIDEALRPLFARFGRSIAIFPLVVGQQTIGVLSASADQPVQLAEAQLRQIQSLVGQAAAVAQGLHLLQQSQARAQREQVLRQVTERVRSAVDPEMVLRTAAREVGMALGRNVLIRLESPEIKPAEARPANGGRPDPAASTDNLAG